MYIQFCDFWKLLYSNLNTKEFREKATVTVVKRVGKMKFKDRDHKDRFSTLFPA